MKRYTYSYDNLNRLTDAIYSEPNATTPFNNYFNERLSYDLNGNIATLKRNASPIRGTTSTLVDDLVYQYTGNRLDRVIENALNDTGYEGGNNFIDYDLNGNMTNMKDKGIQSIGYNYLDVPNSYSITQNNLFGTPVSFGLNYLYRADGTKLRKTYSSGGGKGSSTTKIVTDYIDGFQYSFNETTGPCLWCRTEVAYEQQAFKTFDPPVTTQWTLDLVPTAEGFYSFTENRYIYQYQDHLGNTRVSFAKNSAGVLEVTDTNNFYPFGLNHIGAAKSNLGGYFNYKYNGKELQESGMYDYGARLYMPDLGRWGVVDALAEQMRRFSPYNYAFNNPVSFIDPDGNAPYNPRDIYGEHSAFNGDYNSNSTLSGSSGMGAAGNYIANSTGGGGEANEWKNWGDHSGDSGGSPTFQFPKGKEEYYKKNYPAFYDFVMTDLPKMVADNNFMKVLSTLSGFSMEELTKMFKSDTNYGLIAHNTLGYSNADYPHAEDKSFPINLVRVNNEVLDWFESANRDTKTLEGIKNLFYMTTLIGHEVNHWGEATGGRVPFSKTGLGSMGYNDAGDYFENKLLNDTYKRGIGNAGSSSPGIDAYVKKNFNVLYNIFNKK
ncbi:RHS repeat-associated core domain-containing protein [Chryseobacterium sp. ERMR1:04]|uniref:RHS repeat-associated core domain-containing protein n=1 Tax=Chryseobacterium sp. ERMR1:04 TaxID=1705393 RepID=UPI0006C86E24|nr:RHS repeat-associated core domain-containing protein [Chryseobacterium sp. ERMR1:04]KPH13820.1 hypothetical protein AMQ68_09805 [Chryseobacterium sp. ERMR1:04]